MGKSGKCGSIGVVSWEECISLILKRLSPLQCVYFFCIVKVAPLADLRRVDHSMCDTYADAARSLGYMDDDSSFESSLEEATAFNMPSQLCSFFASLICFCELGNP